MLWKILLYYGNYFTLTVTLTDFLPILIVSFEVPFLAPLTVTVTLPLETFLPVILAIFDLEDLAVNLSVVAFFLFWAVTLTVIFAFLPFLIFTVFLAAFALLTGFATLTVIVAFFPALVSVILAEEPFVAFLGTEILIFLLLVTFTVASFLLELLFLPY